MKKDKTKARQSVRGATDIWGSPIKETPGVELPEFLRQHTGAKTAQIVRSPGDFGLGQIPAAHVPTATTDTVCGYCSTGCSLKVHLKDGQAVNLTPTPDYPVNLGMACPKGWEALAALDSPDRAITPLMRDTSGKLAPVSWQDALGKFRDGFAAIREAHGSDALAFLSTGQICTEEMAFLGMLAKCGLGFAHGDGNTRQCMATSVVAYKQSFGFDAPPYTYADFEESDCIVLIGSNLAIAHPIMWQRVLMNRRSPEIVVIDPRRTETAAAATQHLAIRPKSDLDLLYGLAHVLLRDGAVDREFVQNHTSGFGEFESFLEDYSPALTAAATGIAEAELQRLADTIRTCERTSLWWTMGVNQSHQATRTAQAIINIALMTGNIGKPGTGANSITGQCNAMGSRLFSNTTALLGGRDFADPAHRAEVAALTGVPEESIPKENCLAYDQIIDGIESGRIKALWVLATNTAHSWSGGRRLGKLLDKLDFLVVQDMYANTQTAEHADLVLPAAGWGEKEGTFINSERRIGLAKKVSRAPGEALADFHIFTAIAQACGLSHTFAKWSTPEAVFDMLGQLSAGRPCDFSGIEGYLHLEEARGIQWPWPEGMTDGEMTKAEIKNDKTGDERSSSDADASCHLSFRDLAFERRLFTDGQFFTPDRRARFLFEPPIAPPEMPDAAYPFVLLTGRGSSAQWHTGTRTGKSAILRKLYPAEIYCEISPADAAQLGISAGDQIELSSRRGELRARAKITAAVKDGEVFVPMHYPEVNQLTLQVVDPLSRQPSYKHCAVALGRYS